MTATDLARQGTQAIEQSKPRRELTLEAVIELTGYSLPEVALIRHNMAAGMRCAPEDVPFIDVAMFCKATRSLNLDPLVRQSYWIARQGKGGLPIGIDGFRAIADRAGNYAGSEAPVFRGTIEWEHRGRTVTVPEYCQVTTWKIVQGHKAAFTGEARWVEYVPRLNGAGAESDMWAKMPRNQLAKCAEAQSLRKGWALQMGALPLRVDEPVGDDELPEVAAPERIIEQPAPSRPKPTAADYDRMVGSEATGTFFDGPDQHTAPTETPPRKSKAKEQMLGVDSEAYQHYAALCEEAQALEVDYEALTAPVAASVLADRFNALSEAVQAAQGAAAPQERF